MDLIPTAHMPESASRTEIAEVVCWGDGVLTVDLEGTRLAARVALSCLVQPESGDLVLVGGPPHRLFVLALLERREPRPLRLVAGADLEIAAPAGRITLTSGAAINLVCPGSVQVTAGELALRSRTARLLLDEITYIGTRVAAHVRQIKFIGVAIETLADRLITRAKRSYRFIEEGDHVRSGEIDYRATDKLHLRGKNTFVTAESIVKVDGGQILLG